MVDLIQTWFIALDQLPSENAVLVRDPLYLQPNELYSLAMIQTHLLQAGDDCIVFGNMETMK